MKVGLNGFGRFGLHFLKYYLKNYKNSKFKLEYINDEKLKINDLHKIIRNDRHISFSKFKIKRLKDFLIFKIGNYSLKIFITNKNLKKLKWTNKIDILLECSGNYTSRKTLSFINSKKNIKHVLISATSWDCDQTLIYGLNHEDFMKEKKYISYGSCTVNAFSAFGQFINKNYGIKDADVNIVHNTPAYKLKNYNTLKKKICTLEAIAPKLVSGIFKSNFLVNYTLVPYSGVSMIDFRFNLKRKILKKSFINMLKNKIKKGELKNLYGYVQKDKDANFFKESKFNCDFILEKTKIIKNNLYLFAYFDNENSVNRYYDLANYISKKYL